MADKKKPEPESELVNEEYTDTLPLADTKIDRDDTQSEDTFPKTTTEEPENVDEAKVESIPDDPIPEVITERIIEKRSVFIPAVLGGVFAAGLGFAVAKSDLLESYFPNSQADQAVAALKQALADQSKQVAALVDQVSGIQIPDLSGVETKLTALSAQISPLSTSVKSLETQLATLNMSLTKLADRVTAIEKRPISEGVSKSAIDAYENELKRLQASMVTQRAEVEAMIEAAKAVKTDAEQTHADAASVLQVAANKALLADLRANLETGSPYSTVLGELKTNGATIPNGLAAAASTGVITLPTLQSKFPDAARAALAVARDANKNTETGIAAFFRRQLGARSVSPRDGDDADAVLSRAEAALTDGQVSNALDELSKLPENVQSTMADWIEPAKTRLAAITASDALGRELNTK
ncbi:MAG: hypothetical protein JKY94_12405 [Rhodobacteraceae bacterium]|nr:hypothetical protein [Paracoccaceae bacterium]